METGQDSCKILSGDGNSKNDLEKRTFYTVQGNAEAERLLGDGLPWHTEFDRAHLGDGVYAWGSLEDAEEYLKLRSLHYDDLQIMEFDVFIDDLENMKQLDLSILSDDEVNLFMGQFSRLNDAIPDHGFDYIQRSTGMGVEHYFSKFVFELLHFKK